MNFDNRMIGLSAFAKSGKDTVCTLMKRGLMEIDESYRPVKFPFAASLKKKIDPFLSKEIGISAFTQNKGEKDVIRPFLVLFGETARSLDEDYWANNVKEQILGFDQIYNKDGVKLFAGGDATWIISATWMTRRWFLTFRMRSMLKIALTNL